VCTVALAGLGFGLTVGGVEVGVPAVAAAEGSRTLGGVLLSAWGITSVLAGLAYALRPWPRPLHLRLPVLHGAFALLVAGLAAATGSIPVLAAAMLLTGMLITPQVTAQSLALERATPPGTATEAFGWVVTAITVGVAAGQSVGGWAVEAAGPSAAFLVSGIAGLVVAMVVWLRRGTLAPG
jgi:predicted MFS family arabinose efflux permease